MTNALAVSLLFGCLISSTHQLFIPMPFGQIDVTRNAGDGNLDVNAASDRLHVLGFGPVKTLHINQAPGHLPSIDGGIGFKADNKGLGQDLTSLGIPSLGVRRKRSEMDTKMNFPSKTIPGDFGDEEPLIRERSRSIQEPAHEH
ncbi:hypothetical protein M3Y94_00609800 [Aphelenchoides besseyi]|nr:hypothetical protein M3Y94_00609800 [Aphelenchoides besseyi]